MKIDLMNSVKNTVKNWLGAFKHNKTTCQIQYSYV